MSKDEYISLSPNGLQSRSEALAIQLLLEEVTRRRADIGWSQESDDSVVEAARRHVVGALPKSSDKLQGEAVLNVASDLLKQGWALRVEGTNLFGCSPGNPKHEDTRAYRRSRLISARNEQLREPAVRQFIQQEERGQIFGGYRTSIFSVMADGRDLVRRIDGMERPIVRPIIEMAERGRNCPVTGIDTFNMWRYFRHTWANPYSSIPGRQLSFMIRDEMTPNRSVAGIGMLSSAAAQLQARDIYIGWDSETFINSCKADPQGWQVEWASQVLVNAIAAIYRDDFVQEGLAPPVGEKFSDTQIEKLLQDSNRTREIHHRQAERSEYKKVNPESADDSVWEEQALTPLFRNKRASELAKLSSGLRCIVDLSSGKRASSKAAAVFAAAQGRRAFSKAVKTARGLTLGTEIADLSVCGALPPYNELLAGKLVSALATSPAMVKLYRHRYSKSPSVIGSSMAGRRIQRSANLVLVSTTSLYGIRPNQYDRIAIPAEILGGKQGKTLRYIPLADQTEGWGSFQFGRITQRSLERYVAASKNGWRVNNVFGEGANPRMRGLRDGLQKLGISEDLLQHGLQKAIYVAPLISNVRDYLLGIDSKPNYLFDERRADSSDAAIERWWFERWASKRAFRVDVRERIAMHTLVHPITHGARVVLPDYDVDQMPLM